MAKPCNDCPFRKEGGIRLTPGRVRELSGLMLSPQGGTFSCHKTVNYAEVDDDTGRVRGPDDAVRHCAGALIYAEKHETATQMMRIMERLRVYDHRRLDRAEFPKVWDDVRQWLKAALPADRKAKKAPAERTPT